MRISRSAAAASEPMEATHVSGTVHRRDLGAIEEPAGTALVVTFEGGARTHWHRHPGGQLLYVLAGEARVAGRGGAAITAEPGDLVTAAPDEEHWHGAAGDGAMTHLAVSFGATEWLEPVSDEG